MGQLQSIDVTNVPGNRAANDFKCSRQSNFPKCTVATYKGQYAVCVEKMKRSVSDAKHFPTRDIHDL